jgi:hypothetical protein
MKSASSYLFDLIKSLTNSEKRYFSLFAARHYPEDNHSLRLFHIIGKQNKYDEPDAIDQSGLGKNNFAVQKNILYTQVLNALIQFDTAGSIAIKMQQDVFACQKLIQKGLILQAKTKLRQVKTDAAKYEIHEISLQALQIEANIYAREQYKSITTKELDNWYTENLLLTQKLDAESFAKHTISKAQKIQLSVGGKSISHTDSIKPLLDEVKKKEKGLYLTQKAQMDLMQTEALYHFMDQDTAKAFAINQSFIKLMESERHWIQFYPQRYFSALNNYLIDCFVLKKEKELRSGLDKMRSLKSDPSFKKTANLEPNIFRITYQIELNYLIAAGQFSKASQIMQEVKEGLDKHQGKIPQHHQMNMEYLLAYVLFGIGSYEAASTQLDKLQQYSRSETAALIDDVAAIMQVVCHYEMQNYSILDSLVKSCKRKLGERKKSMPADLEFDVLNAILSFSIKKPDTKDWQKLWNKLCKTNKGQKPHSPHNDYFDLFNYVYAKNSKVTYEEAWNHPK